MYKRRIAALAAVASTIVGTALAVPSSASADTGTATVPNSVPAWAARTTSATAAAKGAVSARVYLAPRGGQAALAALATSMATPGSANYHKFLTQKQYVAKFAPTSQDVSRAESYLKASGLKIVSVGPENRYIAVSGTVTQANAAFHTALKRYDHLGQHVQAPSKALKVPANLHVLTVTGLNTFKTTMKPASIPQPDGFRNAHPCSIYYGQLLAKRKADFVTPLPQFGGKTLAYAPCGYTGPQLRSAYEGSSTLFGDGVTVAITDAYASPSIASDANTYANMNGDGSYAPGQLTQSNSHSFTHVTDCDASGWFGEETLDVEAVHAMAPDANIRYYGARSCEDPDLLDALAQVVIEDKAQLVTNSWGSPSEAEDADSIPAYETVFLQGAVEGISFMFSSGDDGDELANTGIKQVDYPTSDPYVTSVGGTSSEIDANGLMASQTGWGTVKYSLNSAGTGWSPVGFLYGAGGGVSATFNAPAYQVGTAHGPYREVPDVAMDADPNTGMLIGETQTFPDGVYYDQYRIGGTSLASPLFAGMTALMIEHAGTGVGLLNPVIYSHQSGFTDVKATNQLGDVRVDFANGLDATGGLLYSVRTFGQDSSLTVGKGYDQVTGVGTANAGWITALAPAP